MGSIGLQIAATKKCFSLGELNWTASHDHRRALINIGNRGARQESDHDYRQNLNDMKSCCQLIKIMTKFEKETRQRLYVLIKKKQLSRRNARQQHAHMTRSVHFHRHDVLTVA